MTREREIHRRGFAVGYEGRMPLELTQGERTRECPEDCAPFFFDGLVRGHLERERERFIALLAETSLVVEDERGTISIPKWTRVDELERWVELVIELVQKRRVAEVVLSGEPVPHLNAALAAEGVRVLRVLVPRPLKR